MKRYKKAAVIISLFFLLFIIAAMPFIVIDHQNRAAVGRIEKLFAEPAALDEGIRDTNEHSFWERISLIDHDSDNLGMDEPGVEMYSISQQPEEDILDILGVQLEKLYNYDVIPQLESSKLMDLNVVKQTYLHTSDKNTAVREPVITVLEIDAEYEDYAIYACIDSETCAVCNIMISPKKGKLIYPHANTEEAFLNYLESFEPIPDDMDKTFKTESISDDGSGMLWLYIVSVDDITGKITKYRFGKFIADINSGSIMQR